MAHLITGYAGYEHIQSKDTRSFNIAMFGSGEFVMEIGQQLDASIIDNNTVRVLDGDLLMQGGHIRIESDTYEDLAIQTGTAGKNRMDLIVMTYEKNANDGTEKAFLEVLKGTESEGTPSEPEYVTGSLAEGALKNQMPLYKVTISGVVLSDITPLFKTIPTYKTLAEQYAAQFQKACDTYLGALNVLDTLEEIEANTLANQLAGALGVKEGFSSLNTDIESVETNLAATNTNVLSLTSGLSTTNKNVSNLTSSLAAITNAVIPNTSKYMRLRNDNYIACSNYAEKTFIPIYAADLLIGGSKNVSTRTFFKGDKLQNCNLAPEPGTYIVSANNGTVSNAPIQHGILIHLAASLNFEMQFFAAYDASSLHFRVNWGSAWSGWASA